MADLEQIADYIARDNPNRAVTFTEKLEAKCRAAAAAPERFPPRFDLVPGLRMAVHGRYLVFFRDFPADNTVRVERLLHSARNLPPLFRR